MRKKLRQTPKKNRNFSAAETEKVLLYHYTDGLIKLSY
jgi:hypothetical protein